MSNAIELGIKISADGKGAEATINSLTKTIERVTVSSKSAATEAEKLAAKWKALGDAGAAQFKSGAIKDYAATLSAGMSAAGRAAAESAKQFNASSTAAQGYASSMLKLGAAYMSFQAIISATSAIIDATRQFDRLKGMMDAASGSAMQSALNMRYVEQVSNQLGMNVMATAESFASLTAATRGTALEGKAAQQIFTAFSKAAAALGKSSADTQGIMLALSQMISKGKVSMEELRQQLGERLPGAFQLAAKAMGVTTAELDKMVSNGQVTAEELLPKLAKALDETYSGARFDKINNQIERLDNAWTKFKANILDTGFLNTITKGLTGFLDILNNVSEASTRANEYMGGMIQAGRKPEQPAQQVDNLDGMKTAAQGAAAALAKLSKEQKAIYDAAIKYKLDPAMMLGLAQRESGFNPSIVNKKDGGRGLFQFMPGTWAGVQKQAGLSPNFNDAFITEKHVDAAMRYMVSIKSIVKNARDVRDYLAAWNYGPERMVKAIEKGKAASSVTTAGHVPFAMKYMEQWQQKLAGAGVASDDKTTKLASKEWGDYYKHRLSLIEQLKDRQNAANDLTVAQQKAALEKIKIAAEDAQKNAEIKIKMAVDQQGMEAAIKAIEEAKTAQDNLLRDASSLGNKDVSKARIELAAIQKQIMETQKTGRWEERGLDLTTKREVAEKKLAEAKIAAGSSDMQLQAALAANAEKYDTMKRVAMKEMADLNVKNVTEQKAAQEAELAYLQKQEQFRQQIGEQAAQGAKAAIDSQLQQQQAAMAGQKAERDAQLQNLSGLAQIQQARQNITLDLQDQLTLVEAEKQATQAKLAIDQQMLGYQEQMLQAQLASTSERERRLEIESAIAQIHLQQADNLRAAQNAATQANAAAAKAQSAAAKGMGGLDAKEVKERQLRENAYWDQTIERVRRYGQVWSEILGQQADGFGNVALSMAQFGKDLDQITNKYDELDKQRKSMDENGNTRAKETAAATLQAIAATSLGMRKMFKEGSDGYKAMTAMAGAAALAQDALNISDGIAAILKQLKEGDPYSAIPRALAVAGMVMSMIGHAVGTIAAMGGGNNTVTAADRQKTQGTGSVFGDGTAQSQSIANSLEIIKSNSSNDLNYSAAMLRALEDLSLNILALANQVTMTVMPSIDAAIKASGMKFGKQNISLFSGFNTQLTDSGIGWFETSLEKIFSGGFTAKMYADVTKSFEVMQSALSSETTTYVRNASKDVTNQIAQIFRDMVKALQEGGKAFGLSGQDILDSLKGFKIGMEQISLKDMSMEEQTAALNAVFSKITDKMAERINKLRDLQLDPFRKAGEGMSETLFRVAEGINRSKGLLEQLGMTAVDYKSLSAAQKQGDVAAEIFRSSIQAQTQLSQSVRDYVGVLKGSAEDIRDAYKQIISASNLLKTAGIGDANLSQTMTNAAGGLDAFVAAMESFNENFLSQADRYAGDVRVLIEQFGALGYALPDSKDAFVALIRSIDTTDDAGKKLFGQMIALSESFAKVANEAQAIRDKYASILDPFKAISDRIKEVGTDFGKLLAGVTGESQGRINAIGNAAAAARNPLLGARGGLQAELDGQSQTIIDNRNRIDAWQKQLDAELAKKPKNQNKKLIRRLQDYIRQSNDSIMGLTAMNDAIRQQIDDINRQIAEIDSQEGIDKGTEAGRLAAEKIGIIDEARLAMGATLEQIFADIAQTIQQAQQRLQSVLDLQKSLSSQLAQLQGPQAIAALANVNYATARQNIVDYIGGVQAGGTRNVETEVSLIQAGQQAIMDKYNAEIAAIQEAEQAYIAAETERLNAALQLQIDAINAATDAAIEAENDRLNAAIKAQQKIDQAAIKAQQKQFDAANKLTQKQFDLEQKALQKVHDAQLKALGDELDAANKLKDAIASINDYVRGMALGGNSPLSPEQRLAEAQRQYQELLGRAQGGDADAMQKLSGASDAYLEASKQYYGSGTQYANTFDAVKNAMSAIGGMSAPDPDSIQSRIDLLREAQAEEMDLLRESQAERLDAIRELQSEQLDLIREQQQESLDAMRQASQKTQEEIRKAAQAQIEDAQKATQQAIADLSDPTKNAAMKAAREAAERDLRKLQELAELTRQEAQRQADEAKRIAQENAQRAIDLANAQLEQLQAGTRLNTAQLEALNSILVKNGLNPIQAYAKGGYAQAGMALVGEQGPEIVRFERPAQVMTADETRDALRGGNNDAIVQAIAELKAEMRAVVVTQSNTNPQIIEKLSGMEQRLSKMERNARIQA